MWSAWLTLSLNQTSAESANWKVAVLTDRSSAGRSPPLLMPLFMEMKRSSVVLSFTQGLWRLVLSMMMANDRM